MGLLLGDTPSGNIALGAKIVGRVSDRSQNWMEFLPTGPYIQYIVGNEHSDADA
jgi:hypothetical protein